MASPSAVAALRFTTISNLVLFGPDSQVSGVKKQMHRSKMLSVFSVDRFGHCAD
jgi:hypothetical protein